MTALILPGSVLGYNRRMFAGRRKQRQARLVSGLLVLAVFMLTIQPMHVHLQHADHPAAPVHDHDIGLHHVIDDIASTDHLYHGILSLTPDVMLKHVGDYPLLTAIIVCLAILLPAIKREIRQRPTIRPTRRKPGRFSLIPPLRAPPVL